MATRGAYWRSAVKFIVIVILNLFAGSETVEEIDLTDWSSTFPDAPLSPVPLSCVLI
jgi:hypothetical protein